MWQKSQVDPVVKQLEAADKQQDAYMTAFRYINDGYAALPDGDFPLKTLRGSYIHTNFAIALSQSNH